MKLLVHCHYLNVYFSIIIFSVFANCNQISPVKELVLKSSGLGNGLLEIPFLSSTGSFSAESAPLDDRRMKFLKVNKSNAEKISNISRQMDRRSLSRRQFHSRLNPAHRLTKHRIATESNHHLQRKKANFVHDNILTMNYQRRHKNRFDRRKHTLYRKTDNSFFERERNNPRSRTERHRNYRRRHVFLPRKPIHFIVKEGHRTHGHRIHGRRIHNVLGGSSYHGSRTNTMRNYRRGRVFGNKIPENSYEGRAIYSRSGKEVMTGDRGYHNRGRDYRKRGRGYDKRTNNRLWNYHRIHLLRQRRPEIISTKQRNFRRSRINNLEGDRRYRPNEENIITGDGGYHKRERGYHKGGRDYYESRTNRLRNYHRSHVRRQRVPKIFFTKENNFRRSRFENLEEDSRYPLREKHIITLGRDYHKGRREYDKNRTNRLRNYHRGHVPGEGGQEKRSHRRNRTNAQRSNLLKHNSKRGRMRIIKGHVGKSKQKHMNQLSRLTQKRIRFTSAEHYNPHIKQNLRRREHQQHSDRRNLEEDSRHPLREKHIITLGRDYHKGERDYDENRTNRLRNYHRGHIPGEGGQEKRSYRRNRTNAHRSNLLKHNSRRGRMRTIKGPAGKRKQKHMNQLSRLTPKRIRFTGEHYPHMKQNLRRREYQQHSDRRKANYSKISGINRSKYKVPSFARGVRRRIERKHNKKQHIKKGLKRTKTPYHGETKNAKVNSSKEGQKKLKPKPNVETDCEVYKKKLEKMAIIVNRSVHKVEILAKIIGRKFGIDAKTINQILRKQENNMSSGFWRIFK